MADDVKTRNEDEASKTKTGDESRLSKAKRSVHESGVEFFESGQDGSLLWLVRRAWQWCGVFIEGLNDWLAIRRDQREKQGSFDEDSLAEIERGGE